MTMLAEKLKAAGIDTWGSKVDVLIVEGVRLYPNSVGDIGRYVGDHPIMKDRIRSFMRDMNAGKERSLEPSKGVTWSGRQGHAESGPTFLKPYKPREKEPERTRKIEQVVSKYKNSGGISWSKLTPHEGIALMRDGREAEALNAALGANIPNDGRNYGNLLGVKRVDEIIASVRAA